MDLVSTGSTISKKNIISVFVTPSLEDYTKTSKKEVKDEKKEEINKEIVQEEVKEYHQTSLDDFYQDFKL